MFPEIEKMAKDYREGNHSPRNLTQQQLVSYIVQAIDFINENNSDNLRNQLLLTAISACASTLLMDFEPFTQRHPGIPWEALRNLVDIINFRHYPAHGLAGNLHIEERSIQSLEEQKVRITEISKEISELKDVLTKIQNLSFYEQHYPICCITQSIVDKNVRPNLLKLLSNFLNGLSESDTATEEGRIEFLRLIAGLGEILVQLPELDQRLINSNMLEQFKNLRNLINHPERLDDRVRINSFIKTGKMENFEIENFIQKQQFIISHLKKIKDGKSDLAAEKYIILFFKKISAKELKNNAARIQCIAEFFKLFLKAKDLSNQDAFKKKYQEIYSEVINWLKSPESSIQDIGNFLQQFYLIAIDSEQKESKKDINEISEIFFERLKKSNDLNLLSIIIKQSSDFFYYSKRPDKNTVEHSHVNNFNDIQKRVLELKARLEENSIQKVEYPRLPDNKLVIKNLRYHLKDHKHIDDEKLMNFLLDYEEHYEAINRKKHTYGIGILNEKEISFIDTYLEADLERLAREKTKKNNHTAKAAQLISLMMRDIKLALKRRSSINQDSQDMLNCNSHSEGEEYLILLNKYKKGHEILKKMKLTHLIKKSYTPSDTQELKKVYDRASEEIQEEIIQLSEDELSMKFHLESKARGINSNTSTNLLELTGYTPKLYKLTESERNQAEKQLNLNHRIREFYQICIGSYARALLVNPIFRQMASSTLYSSVDNLMRVARGYLAHNTIRHLGAGYEAEMHSSEVFCRVLDDCKEQIAELEKLEKILVDTLLAPVIESIATKRSTQTNSVSFFSAHNQLAAQLKNEAERFGFRCINVLGDGNCFLRSIEEQLGIPYRQLLAAVVDHIINNLELYHDSITEDINTFIEKLSCGGQWADHVFIQAASRALNINIVIIRSDGQEPTILRRENASTTVYLGYEVGLHYQSLVRDETIGQVVRDIQGNIDSTLFDEVTQFNASQIGTEIQQLIMSLLQQSNSIPEALFSCSS